MQQELKESPIETSPRGPADLKQHHNEISNTWLQYFNQQNIIGIISELVRVSSYAAESRYLTIWLKEYYPSY